MSSTNLDKTSFIATEEHNLENTKSVAQTSQDENISLEVANTSPLPRDQTNLEIDLNDETSLSDGLVETSHEDFYLNKERKRSLHSSVDKDEYSPHLDDAEKSLEIISEYEESVSEIGELAEETCESDTTIDRQMYYELYNHYKQQHRAEKMKNNFLQSRLASYYSRKKMMYVLREQTINVSELQNRYERELDTLEQLIETSERGKAMALEELAKLKTKQDVKSITLEEMFKKYQQSMIEYGKTLTLEKTGKSNMDKITEKFIKRQNTQMKLIKSLQLKYIQLRNKLSEKFKALNELDHLGPGYRIMDYVQLKIDNRDLHDKLEEKDSELIQLRKNCQHTMQVLAHNREKIQVADLDKEKLQNDLEEVDRDLNDAREQLHYLKRERDGYRDALINLKNDFGLLTNPKLLKNMCFSMREIDVVKNKLEKVQLEYKKKSEKLIAVRRNIEYYQRKKENNNVEHISTFTSKSHKDSKYYQEIFFLSKL